MKKAIVISLIALVFTSANVWAQTEKDFTANYDARVRQTLAMFPDLPSIALVVIKNDKPIFLRAYGMADREAGRKADTDTLYATGYHSRRDAASADHSATLTTWSIES
jgi:CubicO group peptidase (beta-lactamase class C family)